VEEGALGLPIPVTLKLEHTQVTGSFKVRGAFNNMLSREVPQRASSRPRAATTGRRSPMPRRP
jgi:threonine dehydratase